MNTYNPPLSKLESHDRQFVIRTIIGFCLALGSILALHGVIYFLQREQIEQESDTATLVAASGEQRMRSQRIALLSLALLNVQSDSLREKTQESLSAVIDEMEKMHQSLVAGDPSSGITANKSEAVRNIFFGEDSLDNKVRNFVQTSRILSKSPASALNIKNPQFFFVTEQSSELLNNFYNLTRQYKLEGIQGTEHLLRFAQGAFIAMFIAVIGIGIFVFNPIIRRLKVEFHVRSQTQRELVEQNKELEQFSATIAHDLKAPLNNIGGFSQFLKTKLVNQDDREALELMEYIEQGVKRMTQMITELLQYARLTKKEVKFDKVSPNKVISRVLKDFESQIRETGAKFSIAKLPIIRGDALQFEHLFQNLISNALKFRHPDRAPVIEIFALSDLGDNDLNIRIAVQDNGRGFPVGAEEKMFEPFRRLNPHMDTDGSGFGLALCKKIMNRHNGIIHVENVPSGGARFILTFTES